MSKDDDKNILERLIGGVKEATDLNNKDKLLEKVDGLKESEKQVDNKDKKVPPKNPIGLDIGTSRIVSVQKGIAGDIITSDQLNAFFTFPDSAFAKEMLNKNNMKYKKVENDIAVLGYDSQEFANIFNSEIRRPMKKGLLKSDEEDAIPIIKSIIDLVVPKAKEMGSNLCFSVPSPQVGYESDLVFHETILRKYLIALGYNAKSVTEGMAIILSELSDDNYTGIGISMGAGMCNLCLSFLSVPVITFSIPRGGDDIDISVARVVNETVNRVRVLKEDTLDFSRAPSNKMENALLIYYEDLIMTLLNQLAAVLSQTENLPILNHSIPIVLAGGTCMPNGFKVKFDKIMRQINLPIQISEIKVASDPLRATAKGALIFAGV